MGAALHAPFAPACHVNPPERSAVPALRGREGLPAWRRAAGLGRRGWARRRMPKPTRPGIREKIMRAKSGMWWVIAYVYISI